MYIVKHCHIKSDAELLAQSDLLAFDYLPLKSVFLIFFSIIKKWPTIEQALHNKKNYKNWELINGKIKMRNKIKFHWVIAPFNKKNSRALTLRNQHKIFRAMYIFIYYTKLQLLLIISVIIFCTAEEILNFLFFCLIIPLFTHYLSRLHKYLPKHISVIHLYIWLSIT